MSDRSPDARRNRNIWAPWRIQYIDELANGDDGCFLCRYRDDPDADAANYVIWRTSRCLTVLNRFPYTGGHSMVAPLEHLGEMGELDAGTMCEMMELVRDLQEVLRQSIRAEGFNIGINVGRCAGAGLPGHLHIHVVPRWRGDTNIMPVFADVHVIPQSLQELYSQLASASAELKLPRLSGS